MGRQTLHVTPSEARLATEKIGRVRSSLAAQITAKSWFVSDERI